MQCLEQAVYVAGMNEIDLNEIRRWSINEGYENKFNEFKRKLC